MSFLAVALAITGLWVFWGIGFALWIFPRDWHRFVFPCAIPVGLALQIAVGWILLHLGYTLGSTAGRTLLLPAGMLLAALLRPEQRRLFVELLKARETQFALALIVWSLVVGLAPTVFSPHANEGLLTFSIGSCDAPDYAMGARLFLEKGNHLESGFWSQKEVQQLFGLDFWTYWTNINHVGPAICWAYCAALLPLPLWSFGSVLTSVLAASITAVAFAFMRAVLRFDFRSSVLVSVLYSISPLWLYALYNVAAGQLAGTLALTSLLLLAYSLPVDSDQRLSWRHVLGGSLCIWLLISNYAFLYLFAGATIAAIALYYFLLSQKAAGVRLLIWFATSSLIILMLFPERWHGGWLAARLFNEKVFGWAIPRLTLGSILGLVKGFELTPLANVVSLLFTTVAVALALKALSTLWKGDRHRLAAPVTIGVVATSVFITLWIQDPSDSTLNSYKQYKIVATFLPVLLPCIFTALATEARFIRTATLILVAALIGFELPTSYMKMYHAAKAMPLRSASDCAALVKLEGRADIESVNIVSTRAWDRLWASVLLAEKRQYFREATYLTRGPVPLQGAWTFEDREAAVYQPSTLYVGSGLVIRPVKENPYIEVTCGPGWWGVEDGHRWSGANGRSFELVVETIASAQVNLELRGQFPKPGARAKASLEGHDVSLTQNGGHLFLNSIHLPAGKSTIRIEVESALYRCE